jgi:hypothetical protein
MPPCLNGGACVHSGSEAKWQKLLCKHRGDLIAAQESLDATDYSPWSVQCGRYISHPPVRVSFIVRWLFVPHTRPSAHQQMTRAQQSSAQDLLLSEANQTANSPTMKDPPRPRGYARVCPAVCLALTLARAPPPALKTHSRPQWRLPAMRASCSMGSRTIPTWLPCGSARA